MKNYEKVMIEGVSALDWAIRWLRCRSVSEENFVRQYGRPPLNPYDYPGLYDQATKQLNAERIRNGQKPLTEEETQIPKHMPGQMEIEL